MRLCFDSIGDMKILHWAYVAGAARQPHTQYQKSFGNKVAAVAKAFMADQARLQECVQLSQRDFPRFSECFKPISTIRDSLPEPFSKLAAY